MLRKLVILGLVVAGGAVVWMTNSISKYSISIPPDKSEVQSESNGIDSLSLKQEDKSQLKVGHKILAVAIFVLLIPVVTAPLANRLLDKQSNTANLVLLFGYTGLDVLAAYMIGVVVVGGIVSAIGYLIALLAVFSYNLWICAFLARLRKT